MQFIPPTLRDEWDFLLNTFKMQLNFKVLISYFKSFL